MQAMSRRFFAPDATDRVDTVALPDDEAYHLTQVLRLASGAAVVVFDGKGGEWDARVAAIDRSGVTIALDRRRTPVAEPAVKMTLAVGVLKGDHMDAVVRDATALGVSVIAPIASAHVTVPPRAWQSGRAVDRWRRVATAAVKQCGRAVIPEVRPVTTFDDVLASNAYELVVMALEPAADGLPDLEIVDPPPSVLALVGPEGGWSADEISLAAARGARAVRLGPRRLRADLAPAVLLGSLWTRWKWP
jgi:16S rRNA (uracil1498-N3)-methyltransferase